MTKQKKKREADPLPAQVILMNKDRLSSVTLALALLFFLLAVMRAGDADTSLMLRWPVYAVIAGALALWTWRLRRQVEQEWAKAPEPEPDPAEDLRQKLSERPMDVRFTKIEPAGDGRFRCEIEFKDDQD